MSIFYSKSFYDRDYQRTRLSAEAVTTIVSNTFANAGASLRSVIDIGCGRGVWLVEFAARGVQQTLGRDGPWVNNPRLLIAPEHFVETDLSKPFTMSERFDLAMSLEVAEHIDELGAETFVDNLVQLSDTIMFSAAIAGQGGQHHVNEQPLSYWVQKFAQRGYRPVDALRPHIWNNQDICWWYRQNLVFFCRDSSPHLAALERYRDQAPAILDLAHPQGFKEKAKLANLFSPEEYLALWFHRAKQAVFGAQ